MGLYLMMFLFSLFLSRTNVAEEPTAHSYCSSRGQLVSSFLIPESLGIDNHVRDLTSGRPSPDYAGFNLALFSPSDIKGQSLSYDAALVSNGGGGGTISCRSFSDGERHAGGMSNGIDGLDADSWPKVKQGQGTLNDLLDSKATTELSDDEIAEELFSLLAYVDV